MTRLAPVEAPFTPEVEALLRRYPQRGGVLLSLFRVFANSARFLGRGVPNLLDEGSPLSLRQREIAILRVTARYGCEYEWGVHVAAFARRAGLSDAEVAATCGGADAWAGEERVLVAAIDALVDRATLDDAALEAFAAAFTPEQQLEIMAIVGAYHTVSCVSGVARLAPEPFGARFPASAA